MNEHASSVNLTDRAAGRVREIIDAENGDDLKLRVFIQGGGCSGFQYGFQLDQEQQDDDEAIENQGVTLLVDSLSLQYLEGSEVDFIDDLMGARFVVNNPNATTTCGCGASFSV